MWKKVRALLQQPTNELRHEALFHAGHDGLVDSVVPFVREGVREGEAVLVGATPAKLAAIRAGLQEAEIEAVQWQRNDERYARPSPLLGETLRWCEAELARGQRVRLLSEPPLASASHEDARELSLIDAAFNEVAGLAGVAAVCLYDLEAVPSRWIAQARRSHAELVERDGRRPSEAYVGPRELLADEHLGPLPWPSGAVQELICPAPDEACSAARELGRGAGLPDHRLEAFVEAVGEVATNAWVHALPDRGRFWWGEARLVCEVSDYGPIDADGSLDPLTGYTPPTAERPGGGLWRTRQLADLVQIRSHAHRTVVRVHVDLPSVARAATPR
ncbi:sensor histidine kinase [Egibacter rhizosphaerae]|uniref:sensor histidine kinase n=1 Tax=Egibacter rhizosphaerae TaxID=1670831 RepID=UPI0013F16538|nr:sensor histidine kinase [Egibacter rhizosphaerae]